MNDLHQKEQAIDFYENRYEEGYMEDWDPSKKEKIKEILLGLPLPATGKILDFGCGNGVFTRLIKDVLPLWNVYGVELSSVAVKNASRRNPDCTFFNSEEAADFEGVFDVLFSHHVIEHVQDLGETFTIINNYLKPEAFQIHVLPCGNEGSLEHQLCLMHPGGIKEHGLFFFEEPGHLRRLTSDGFARHESSIGFQLEKAFFANQVEGGIDWITKSSPRFVRKLTDVTQIDDKEKLKAMKEWRGKLLPLTYAQFPYSKYLLIKEKWNKTFSDKLKLAALFIPAMFAKPFYDSVRRKANTEWRVKSMDQNGSEMFLFFSRKSSSR